MLSYCSVCMTVACSKKESMQTCLLTAMQISKFGDHDIHLQASRSNALHCWRWLFPVELIIVRQEGV